MGTTAPSWYVRSRASIDLRRIAFVVCSVSAAAAAAPAQAPRYHLPADTLRYQVDLPYHMYWVHGTDTIGSPQNVHRVESQTWTGPDSQPDIVVRELLLDVSRHTQVDTFTIAPNGHVLSIDHRAPFASARPDLLLQLPPTPLQAGSEWTDTVRAAGSDPAGADWYEVIRTYRVRQLVDTMGAHGVADVTAQGVIRTRFGFWVDSVKRKTAWIDVTGPVTEQYLFDVAGGRLLARRWSMDLHGRGVPPGKRDTLEAGFRSTETRTLSDSPRIRFLLAGLPGADTSISIDTARRAAILLHTVDRRPDSITSSLSRNDGLLGVATVQVHDAVVTGYRATWADSTPATQPESVSVRGRALVLSRAGRADTLIPLPDSGAWGIADYAMQELLAPVVLALPRDETPHPFAVFRPYAAHWDTGTATAGYRAGLILVTLRLGTNDPEALLYSLDGDYLFGENSEPDKARRVPVNADRRARVESAFKILRQ